MFSNEPIRVLVLEDDPDFLQLVKIQLRRLVQEFIVVTAERLEDAIAALRTQRFDAVLSDLSLPDSEGFQTIKRLRQTCPDLPVIVLTSLEDDKIEAETLRSGAQDYLVKGEVSNRELNRAILHAVQRQRSANETRRLISELESNQKQLALQSRLLRKKNRRLKQLYRTAQEFVDNVSHDFRTPLTVIKDYVSIIKEGLVGPVGDEQQSLLEKVAIRTDDLNNMVDDLLDVSKLESGLISVWRRELPIADLLRRTESLLRQRAGAKGVRFDVYCDPSLPDVYCDAEKVDRVVTNLAVNAIKFSNHGESVRVAAEADPAGRQVVISVSDTGPGIEAETLSSLFKRFEQIDGHLKSTVKGFGLGLNIAQQFCRLNLGEISVKSQPGSGATFSFSLPMADPLEVVERWLGAFRKPDDVLHLHEIVADAKEANDFDSFLNCLVRANDLIFRVAANRWLLLIAAPQGEVNRWTKRVQQEFLRHNRNRPLGPLPGYSARRLGEWDSESPREVILDDFEESLAGPGGGAGSPEVFPAAVDGGMEDG